MLKLDTLSMRFLLLSAVLVFGSFNLACDQDSSNAEAPSDVVSGTDSAPPALQVTPVVLTPGVSLGPVQVGMTVKQLKDAVGEPDKKSGFRRTINLSYISLRLEVVVSTLEDDVVSDDCIVVSVGTLPGAIVEGDLSLGDPRAVLDTKYGEPTLETGPIIYYSEAGLGVELDDDGNLKRVSVWSPFSPQVDPPEMQAPIGLPTNVDPSNTPTGEMPTFEFDGEVYDVVDAHLHTGQIHTQIPEGMAFLVSQIPALARLYFPGTTPQVLSPYDPYQGIQEHTRTAGVGHAVILATYTHHTIGYASNRELEEKLTDPRNVSSDGRPWAWGMASINYEGFEDADLASSRLEALSGYFEQYPELFIGIKLAHAHQAVSFEDPIYLGVYDVAAKYQVPVLLHTGFSPFPNTKEEPEFYDPLSLESTIEAYDGDHGLGRVDFVLSHIGQGDARAIEHSLQLAETYDNVWLELSAINRPLLIDENGQPSEDKPTMHNYVISEIKKRGLIDRLIFATDGPQYFGKVHTYLNLMATTMKKAEYTPAEMRAVFSENFYRCFGIK